MLPILTRPLRIGNALVLSQGNSSGIVEDIFPIFQDKYRKMCEGYVDVVHYISTLW